MEPTQNEPKKDDYNDVDSLEGSSVVVEGSALKLNEDSPTIKPTVSSPNGIVSPKPADANKELESPQKQFKLPGIGGFASRINVYLLLFIFVLAIAAVVTFVALNKQKGANATSSVNSTTLDQQALGQIAGTGSTTIGDSKQVLDIQSNTVFVGTVSVKSNLDVAGSLQVGDAITIPNLTVSGTGSFNTIQATSGTISGNETVNGLLTVQKGINVSGPVTFSGSLSATSLSVNSLSLTGDLTLQHHVTTTGSIPAVSSTSGGASTASVSGNDTAGTINIGDGSCASLTFAQKFSNTPHIVTTLVGANLYSYLQSDSSSGFTVCGSQAGTYSINYIVID